MDLISSAILAIALTHSLWVILSIVLSPVILTTHETNPPYNSKGAVHADRIDKTIISNNNFTTSSGSSILSEGVTNSKIQGNIFNRWGSSHRGTSCLYRIGLKHEYSLQKLWQ